MALVVCNAGELKLLDWAIKDTSTPENLTLKLYKVDYTPVAASVAGDFTEADFTSYSAKTLTRSTWAASSTNGSGKAASTYTAQSWTCGSTGNTIYGYFVVGATSGTLIWAEKFATARTLVNGDELNITPAITLASE